MNTFKLKTNRTIPFGTRWDSLTIFCMLFGFAVLLDSIAHPPEVLWSLHGLRVLVAGVLIIFPWRPQILVLLAGLCTIAIWQKLPTPQNHWMTLGTFSLYVFPYGLYTMLRRQPFNRDAFYQNIAVIGRIILIVLYFYAVLHKLNYDFFNLSQSCALELQDRVATPFGFPSIYSMGNLQQWAVIYGTMIAEAAIPLLLIFPRTRKYGIIVGMSFHGLLSLNVFYDFTGILYMLFFLFTPQDFPQIVYEKNKSFFDNFRGWRWFGIVIVVLFTWLGVRNAFGFPAGFQIFIPFWVALLTITLILYIPTITIGKSQQDDYAATYWRPRNVLQGLLAVLIIFNGFAPYLGLKTNYSFEMFSNLNVENNQTNHWFMPLWLQVVDYPNELVTITETNNPIFNNYVNRSMNLTVNRLEFERNMYGSGDDTYAIAIVAGEEVRITGEAYESPPWVWKFISFDHIELGEQYNCSW